MAKLWLANDGPKELQKRPLLPGGLHLFVGTEPPSFNEGGSTSNDDCEYLGKVPAESVRGTLPEPREFAEVLVAVIGGAS